MLRRTKTVRPGSQSSGNKKTLQERSCIPSLRSGQALAKVRSSALAISARDAADKGRP